MRSHLERNAFKPKELLRIEEIEEVFANSDMYEKNSFAYIEENGTYDYEDYYHTMAKEASLTRAAFKRGCSIRVCNMEDWNMGIARRANELKYGTDVHMYLCPPVEKATGFDWHQDDRDVYVHMIYGTKTFEVDEYGNIAKYKLMPGDVVFLPQKFKHRAIPDGPSCQLSFGLPNEDSYFIPEGIVTDDLFHTN